MFPAVDLNQFLLTSIGLYLIISIRYFAVSGLFYWLLWKRDTRALRLQDTKPAPKTVRNEIKWSLVTSVIFALPGAYMIEAWKVGATEIYLDPFKYGIWYLPLSLIVYMFLHDTYFYWTHRWMHRPKVFRVMHRVHHDSPNPTPWAAFSFHPTEGVVEAIIIPVLAFFIPIHAGVLVASLTIMTLNGVANHAGYEIYPQRWVHGFWGKHIITATHHNLHHKLFSCNYALYFRFWDKLMKTDKWTPKGANRLFNM